MVDTGTNRPLRVFLCHSSTDKPAVRELYKRLVADGIDAWFDEESLVAGQTWRVEIPKAVRNSDVVIVCLSSAAVGRAGYVQKEINFALDVAEQQPEGTIFIIPLKLEECKVPDRLSGWHWVNYFEPIGYGRVMRALQIRAKSLGANTATSYESAIPSASEQTTTEVHQQLGGVKVDAAEVKVGNDFVGRDKDDMPGKARGTSLFARKRDYHIRITPWNLAISMWLTILIIVVIGLISRSTLSPIELVVAGLMTFVFATIPILIVVHDRSRVLQYSLAFLAIVMGGLWWYSANAHSGMDVTPRQSLSSYGFPQVDVEIRYPRWLTVEDIGKCNNLVIANLIGDPAEASRPLEATLDFNHQVLYAVDEKCSPAQPVTISATNKSTALALAALNPLNVEALSTGTVGITLLVRNLDESEKLKPVLESAFLIQLEEPIWSSIRDFCRAAFGATTVSCFVWITYDRRIRKKDKS